MNKNINDDSEIRVNIPSKPWKENYSPRRVLAIRLHAIGDVVISLPYLQYLKRDIPGVRLDLLIREETDDIPKNLLLFDHVYSIGGGRNYKKQLLHSITLLPRLFKNHYDVVIDLQNNIVSKFFRKGLMPKAWSEFDRFSSIPAGIRTKNTIDAIGLKKCYADTHFMVRNQFKAIEILKTNGWKDNYDLVILNPAGAFETRNWPLNNYVSFATQWLVKFPKTQFLVLGVGAIALKANNLKKQLADHLIDLVNSTSSSEAFAIVQHAKFVLSEDSGLMHMAWVSGIPTLALFGSTRSDWARPLGQYCSFLDSSDLSCGNCMKEHCKFGDINCLVRYSPEFVVEKAFSLITKLQNDTVREKYFSSAQTTT